MTAVQMDGVDDAAAKRKVLIITVGTPDPVVVSIAHHRPDFVYFICSDSPQGSQQQVDGPTQSGTALSIVARVGLLPGQYRKIEIPLSDIDRLHAIYDLILAAFDEAVRDESARIVVDYTGGTKSMTGAVLRAATSRYAAECRLSVVGGQRNGTGTVIPGTEQVYEYASLPFTLEDRWDEALKLFNGGQYGSSESLLKDLVAQAHTPRLLRVSRSLKGLCYVFDQWDRFMYPGARNSLTEWMRQPEHAALAPALAAPAAELGILTDLLRSQPRAWTQQSLLPVLDMWRNAGRRAELGRYDDALIRLYRAIEMLAQLRLHASYGWELGRSRGLTDLFTGLCAQREPDGAPDRVGAVYQRLLPHLEEAIIWHRNGSILVHGFRSSTHEQSVQAEGAFRDFLGAVHEGFGFPFRPLPPFPELRPAQFA